MLPDRRPVVVGVDDSGSSSAAVLSAFEFAHLFEAPVIAAHAWSPRHAAGNVTIPVLVDRDSLEESARAVLAAQLAEATRRYPDVAVTEVVEPTAPGQEFREPIEGISELRKQYTEPIEVRLSEYGGHHVLGRPVHGWSMFNETERDTIQFAKTRRTARHYSSTL
ncbi:hypothetical protein FXW78_46590 [Rhodococcus opacus]|nr:hypothetical protein [Rhodococcus opacus]